MTSRSPGVTVQPIRSWPHELPPLHSLRSRRVGLW
jgi:hypothetical protein